MNPSDPELLLRFLDGAVTPNEREQVANLLRMDRDARDYVKGQKMNSQEETMNDQPNEKKETKMSRRKMLSRVAGVAAAGAAGLKALKSRAAEKTGRAVKNGRINQSIVNWCFESFGEKWAPEKTADVAVMLGCKSVEFVAPKHLPLLKQRGLTCAILGVDMSPDPPFRKGWNNPDYWPRVEKATRDAIDAAAAFGAPNVIVLTGYSAKNPDDPASPQLSLEEGAKNCVAGLKRVIGYAEEKKINLCLEMLNSRDTSHPMKGHPGYQGDHTDYCVDIIRAVGSPRMKLLFDIYHVSIMDGDIIRRIRQHKDVIGHVHTAGNPGRGELDDPNQEIAYPAIMRALLEIGYTGFVAQEFIPTRPPVDGLAKAVALCDV
jgi:hydroxypyruvate isomerase